MISRKEKERTEQAMVDYIGGTDLTSIVDSLYSALYQFAVNLTRSESDAADLVQQTFLTLIQRWHQIRDFSKMKSWLFTTLHRNFLQEVRRKRKHSEVEFQPGIHDFPAGDPEAWRSLDAHTVLEALLQIDQDYRTVLELFYLGRLSYKEIGKTLRLPIGTVMSKLYRGKAQIRLILSRSVYGSR